MKVAVLSPESTCGKSTLIAVLSAVFARSQGRTCMIMSTGDITDNLEIAQTETIKNDASNPYILKSMLGSATKDDKTLFDYGIRQGSEHVLLYDILSAKMDPEDKEEMFFDCLKKVPTDLSIVEICGDINSEFNQKCISMCDCFLVLFTNSRKGFRRIKEFRDTAEQQFLRRCAFVCSRYSPTAISEKALSASTGIPVGSMINFPYNVAIETHAVKGMVDKCAYSIIVADYEVQSLRIKMLEMMQFIFDSEDRKVIKEINKWFR